MVKLNKECKEIRKDLLDSLPVGSTMAMSECGFTVLVVPDESVNWVTTAVACFDDTPRRKVGEFYALCRWEDKEGVPFPKDTGSAAIILESLGFDVKPFKNGEIMRVI